ncbi:TniB family NTP-binding protein [Azospirillum sp. TSO22-1]|uniref:TniB family NTP-binding protein n=1 Tax=Azospirillum sp. TSO22-1 TaxID=716789 RepID=UPI0018EE4F0E|nr:TniB family NTP-binding protein [Azospirillum sp. TSO22-1]
MSEDFQHLHVAYRPFAASPDDDRIARVRADRWIQYPAADAALARLADVMSYPPRDRMPCLLLYGDTGMGKTMIIRRFTRAHMPNFEHASGLTTMPVVAFQMPPEPDEADFYGELFTALGAPQRVSSRPPAKQIRDLCRQLLRTMGTRLLIIDEVHAMLAGTYRQQRIFLNTIRFLANDLRIPLVCAGTDLARQALLTDPQLAERFDALHLPRWRDGEPFRRLLASLCAVLPLRKPSDLDSADVRKRVLELTDGVTVRICRLIETAAVDAIRSGREHLDLSSFTSDSVVLPLVSMTMKGSPRPARGHASTG